MTQIYRGQRHDELVFAFFVLRNFQLLVEHFPVLT